MNSIKKNESLYINILKSLSIMLVVSGHVGGFFKLLGLPYNKESVLFPAYSFHMPMFIFLSGYFYKIKNELNFKYFTKKKFLNLVIPYMKVNIFYGILIYFLLKYNIFTNTRNLSLWNLFIEPWISGYQFNLNGPGWFVLFLFLLQVSYLLFRLFLGKILKNNKKIDITLMCLFLLFGFVSTYKSIGFNVKENFILWVVYRTLFGFQFFHLGYIFKTYFLNKNILNIHSFIILLITKIIFINIFGNYTFSMRALIFYDEWIYPVIVSVLGIFYLLHVGKFILFIISKLNSIYIINMFDFIGKNTWSIMMHHMLFNLMYNNSIGLLKFSFLDYFLKPLICLICPLIWVTTYKKLKSLVKVN